MSDRVATPRLPRVIQARTAHAMRVQQNLVLLRRRRKVATVATYSNLRGQAFTRPENIATSSKTVRGRLVRERDVKFGLNRLPNATFQHMVWRFHVEVALLCCGLDVEMLEFYVNGMDQLPCDKLAPQEATLPKGPVQVIG